MNYLGKGTKKNRELAFEWFEKSASNGHLNAKVSCADILKEGVGVRKDIKKAVSYYNQAANEGNTLAQVSLGNMYGLGDKVEKNLKKAYKLYAKAAEKENRYAQYMLSFLEIEKWKEYSLDDGRSTDELLKYCFYLVYI